MTDSTAPRPHTRFERVMFWAMVPGLLVPIASIVAISLIRGSQDPGTTYGFHSFPGMIAAVFLWILLGSMILRTWMWLRHASTLDSPGLDGASAPIHVAIYVLLIMWPVTFLSESLMIVWILIGVALAVLPMFDQAIISVRPIVTRAPIELARPRYATTLVWVLAVVTVSAITVSVVGAVVPLGGSSTLGLIALAVIGLPWSYLAVTVTTIAAIGASIGFYAVLVCVTAIAVTNVVLVARALRSDFAYTKAVNWFFRLNPPVEPLAPR